MLQVLWAARAALVLVIVWSSFLSTLNDCSWWLNYYKKPPNGITGISLVLIHYLSKSFLRPSRPVRTFECSSPGMFQLPLKGTGLVHTSQILSSQTLCKSFPQKDLRKLSACQSACFSPVGTQITEGTSQSKGTNCSVPPDKSQLSTGSAWRLILKQKIIPFHKVQHEGEMQGTLDPNWTEWCWIWTGEHLPRLSEESGGEEHTRLKEVQDTCTAEDQKQGYCI